MRVKLFVVLCNYWHTVCGLTLDVDVSEEEAKLILDCALGKDSSVDKEGAVEQQDGPVTLPPGGGRGCILPPGGGRGCTLLELLKREQELGSIVTFCAQVDEMLGECSTSLRE